MSPSPNEQGVGPANSLRRSKSSVQWLHSFVTDDKIYSLYLAPDEGTMQEHRVAAVRRLIDPKERTVASDGGESETESCLERHSRSMRPGRPALLRR
jgi:hypothetical protein